MLGKLLLIAALAAGCGLAQDEPPTGGGGGAGGGGGRGGGGGGMDMGGGGMMRSQPSPFDRLSTTLNLDKDQKKLDKTVLDAAAKEASPLRDKISAGRGQIATAIATGKPQTEVDELVKGQALLMAQMAEIEGRAFQQIFAGLTAEQKQQRAGMAFGMFRDIFMKKDWNRNE
ncbi:MAG: hypothetical protein LAQ30_27400 [Acidobacteriia bacterium]|nr:hypothetical protein [Terriglobia bacterium]